MIKMVKGWSKELRVQTNKHTAYSLVNRDEKQRDIGNNTQIDIGVHIDTVDAW